MAALQESDKNVDRLSGMMASMAALASKSDDKANGASASDGL